jgi:glycosyltransferase involved in cell wall biosynthesis
MAKLLAAPHQTIAPTPVLVIRGAPIGTGDELRKDLMQKTQLGANHLHIREYSSDVDVIRRDMLSSTLVLMPSRTEGFGLAALEAIALGIPVLVSDQSGLAETLRELAPNHLKRCIVHVSADLETDAAAWEREIDFVLSDKAAAFARAHELRNMLAPHLSWQKSVRALIQAISAQSV